MPVLTNGAALRPHRDFKWLEVFLHLSFETSQFTRSAMPNAPKIGSDGSLSRRGAWHAPSDSEATV
jgi:NAD+ synthase (glutamine-hydrolysing)